MGKFSFKSSGTTQVGATNQLPTTPLPIGILTPVALGSDDLLQTSTDLATQLTDNLRNLILTNWGERLGLYEFGANLRPITTELVSQDDFDNEAINRIRTAAGRWMPYIDLDSFASSVDRSGPNGMATFDLTITFNIPSLNVRGRQLQVTLYAL